MQLNQHQGEHNLAVEEVFRWNIHAEKTLLRSLLLIINNYKKKNRRG